MLKIIVYYFYVIIIHLFKWNKINKWIKTVPEQTSHKYLVWKIHSTILYSFVSDSHRLPASDAKTDKSGNTFPSTI